MIGKATPVTGDSASRQVRLTESLISSRSVIDWSDIDPALADHWPGQTDNGAALAERLPLYVIVEKILEPGEPLPNDWAVHGTVGYEFARATTGLFVDPAHRRAFDELYTRFTGERRPFAAISYAAKGLMLRTALASETNVLARALNRISEQNRRTRDFTLSALRHAVREVIASFPIYRTYICLRIPHPPAPLSRLSQWERGDERFLLPHHPSQIATAVPSSAPWRWPSGATRPRTSPSSTSSPTCSSSVMRAA